MKLRRKKLDRLPWDHTGRHPGSPLFWKIIMLMTGIGLRYIFRSRHYDRFPEFEGGRVLTAIHLNGLVDPSTMVHSQDRRVISMGRHDLMTMPLLGWFTRRMGSQPVIRKSEIEHGVSDKEYARKINDRTLLTMTNCIASGHNALVMPEGKSHQDSKLHRFKTGPMRFVLNAASIAQYKDLPPPALQAIGLHFRCHYWFRTDAYVEFQEPIPVEAPEVPGSAESLSSGEWVEPPSEKVNHLRDRLFSSLSEVTPNAPDWETYRAWHLIGHIRANLQNQPLRSFKEEVLAARDVRDTLADRESQEALMSPSIEAAKILHEHDLDGRSLEGLKLKTNRMWTRAIAGIFLMALAAPVTIPTTGAQALLAWYMGDKTDEGIDARTTYHFLAGFFSPILFWIPIAIVTSLLLIPPSINSIPPILGLVVAITFLIHALNLVFLLGFDYWTDFSNAKKSSRLESSEQGKSLLELINDVSTNLNLL